jgi:hypothetical protein
MKTALIVIGLICCCYTILYKTFYYIKPGDVDYSKLDRITLDSNYKLYTRIICRPAPAKDFYSPPKLRKRANASANWCNCEGTTTDQEVVERDYLLINRLTGKVIYITPYPIYDENYMLLYNRTVFQTNTFINLWYANMFHFGKIEADGSTIKFKSFKGSIQDDIVKINWIQSNNIEALEFDSATIDLPTRIGKKAAKKMVKVSNIVAPPIIFRKQEHWILGFQSELDEPAFTPIAKGSFLVSPNVIYYDTDYDIIFHLEKNSFSYDGDPITGVRFYHVGRIPYSPIPLKD